MAVAATPAAASAPRRRAAVDVGAEQEARRLQPAPRQAMRATLRISRIRPERGKQGGSRRPFRNGATNKGSNRTRMFRPRCSRCVK